MAAAGPPVSRRKRMLFDGVILLICALLVEGASYVIGRYVAVPYGLLYRAPRDAAGFSDYLRRRDPVNGWTFVYSGKDHDRTGSRINPSYPDPDASPACIALYGDSFTYSQDVDNDHAWSNVLSRLSHCRVANYGYGGYGTDQAFLRFQSAPDDGARTVILGVFSENIMRNVNQYRNLLYPAQYGLKPRFVLDGHGNLELVPLPDIAREDYARFVDNPDAFLPHEFFGLHGSHGPRQLRFPYTLSLLHALRHDRVRALITGKPYWAAFYDPAHPARGLAITERIAVAFSELARARGKRPLVVVIPHPADMAYFQKRGTWTYQSLLALLSKDGVDHLNVGDGLMDRLGGRSPYALSKGLHYDDEGYGIIAELVHERLSR